MLVDAVASSRSLTRLVGSSSVALSFRSLSSLTLLREIKWHSGGMKVDASLIDALKQLPSLQKLCWNDGHWAPVDVIQLCTPPHRLQQLQELSLENTDLSPTVMTSLTDLPSLRILRPQTIECESTSMLPRFSSLHTFALNLRGPLPTAAQQSEIHATLHACTNLTSLLLLVDTPAAEADPLSVLAHLPLTLLEIVHPKLQSLDFLRCLLLNGSKLRHLVLRCPPSTHTVRSEKLPADSLLGLRELTPNLEQLELHRIVRLSDTEQAQFKVPSHLVPKLQRFVYDQFRGP
jgi:hypothetical protein